MVGRGFPPHPSASERVAESRELVVGYVVYELHKNRLHLLNFAVHQKHRRRGVGRSMLEKLKGKLGLGLSARKQVVLEVRERNLDAQLFFQREGFRAIALLRDFYDDPPDRGEDAYRMQYRHGSPAAPIASVSGPVWLGSEEGISPAFGEELPPDWQI